MILMQPAWYVRVRILETSQKILLWVIIHYHAVSQFISPSRSTLPPLPPYINSLTLQISDSVPTTSMQSFNYPYMLLPPPFHSRSVQSRVSLNKIYPCSNNTIISVSPHASSPTSFPSYPLHDESTFHSFFFFSLGFSHHLRSPEWYWISFFHFALSSRPYVIVL